MYKPLIAISIILTLCSCLLSTANTPERKHITQQSHSVTDSELSHKEVLSECTQNSIDNLIDHALKQGTFPGAVVLVAKDNAIIFEKAYGYGEITPRKVLMTTSTLFDIASMSKCVGTTTAAMKLVENGRINLQDPVKKYIEGFKPWTDGTSTVDITVQQLLTHSSGLSAGLSTSETNKLCRLWKGHDREKFVDYIATNTKRNFRPGTRCLYSCLNFIVLQGIVERVTNMRLDEYVSQNVFMPLNMNDTHYFAEGEVKPHNIPIASTSVVSGKTLNGRVHDPLARLLNGGISGNAGIFTTAEDLARYCMFIINGNDKVLKKKSIKKMATIPSSESKIVGRALGWEVNSSYAGGFKKGYCLCHTGYTGTSMVIDIKSKTIIILLTNRVHPKDNDTQKKALMTIRRQLSDIIAEKLLY